MATSKTVAFFVLIMWAMPALAMQCFSDPVQAYAYLLAQKTPKKIGLNSATEAELATLSGIGTKTAQAIVAYRRAHGRFASVEALTQVKGVGEKTLAKNRERLFID